VAERATKLRLACKFVHQDVILDMSFVEILERLYVIVAVLFFRFSDLLVELLALLVITEHLTVGFVEDAVGWSQILYYLFSDRFEEIYVCWRFYFIDSFQILN
jgi:hypothetical protein